MKKISVIVPLYNSAEWVEKCLFSILDQDIPEEEMEIICINDGSPDNSAEIAHDIGKEHSSIVVIDQENQGPSGARNTGMRHATGKYLCFVDPDDYLEPNVFGGLIAQMEAQNLDMLRFDYKIVDENYNPVPKRDFERRFDYSADVMTGAEFLADRLDIACNIWRYLYRTELIVANNIWCFTGDYFDDTPWLPLVLMKAERVGVCDTVVYDYQVRNDSLVKTSNLSQVKKKNQGYLLLIRLLLEEIKGLYGKEVAHESMGVLRKLNLPVSLREKIVSWYKMMIAHSAISLLSSTALYDYKSRRDVLAELKEMGIFPLAVQRVSTKNKVKIGGYNVCPRLMMWMVHQNN